MPCSRMYTVYVIFEEAVKTCCLHSIEIKCFSGQFYCFSNCVIDNNLCKTNILLSCTYIIVVNTTFFVIANFILASSKELLQCEVI